MKQTFIIIALFVLLLGACTSAPNDKTHFAFNLTPDNEILFSNIFDNAEYRLMLAADSVQLGDIERFRMSNRYLGFISNESNNECTSKQIIYILNKGKFDLKLKLANKDNNIDGFKNISDISLGDDNVKLLDKCGKKIWVYDYDGHLKKQIEIPVAAFSFYDIGNGEYWLYCNNDASHDREYQLMRYNVNDSIITKEYLPIDQHIASYLCLETSTNFAKSDRDLFFYSFPDQIIYDLDNDTIQQAYTFDFGKYNVPDNYYSQHFKDIIDFSKKTNRAGYIYYVTNYGISKDNLVLSFLLNNDPFIGFGNIQTNATQCGNILIDDINDLKGFKLDYTNQLFAVYNNVLCMLITSEQLINACKNKNCQDFIDYNKLTIKSNPILLLGTIKKQFLVK